MTTTNIEHIINNIVSFFQKERRKNFIIDNDSEYSKLYLSRSQDGTAHGLFFINVEELLKNNSQIYPTLPGASNHLLNIASRSAFLDVSVYRDRVKEHSIGRKRKNFSERKFYQQPSTLIQTNEISINATSLSPTIKPLIKYFAFSDTDAATKSAGVYQYRVEVKFRDGTYEHLYDMYESLSNTKQLLDQYYELSISSYTRTTTAGFEYNSHRNTKAFSKAAFTQYFKNNSYDQQFALKVAETFSTSLGGIESRVLPEIINAFRVFLNMSTSNLETRSLLIRNNLDPVTGSPAGIMQVIRLTQVFIDRLEVILEVKKLKKAGSNFTAKGTAGSFDSLSLLTNTVSSNQTIQEEHSFDHPSELFHVTSNKQIYSDYLSLEATSAASQQTMKTLSTNYFIERCELENAKYSTKGLLATDIESEYDISLVTNNTETNNLERLSSPKYLSSTGFSYLSPSVIQFLSGDSQNNFVYNAFESIPDDEELEKLSAALLSYAFTKEEFKNADLFDTPFSHESMGYDFSLRELYKEVLEKIGMTVHDLELHEDVFQDLVGASKTAGTVCAVQKKLTPVEGYSAQQTVDLQYTINDFSDATIDPNTYIRSFLNSPRAHTKKLTPVDLNQYSTQNTANFYNLPNSFKISAISSNHSLAGLQFATNQWAGATQQASAFAAYLFFNLNLTVKIEVFRGRMGNAKYDDESWSLLTKDDLQTQSGTLLCRMSYYNEKLVGAFGLPMLDKYFLINSSTSASASIQETIDRISRELTANTVSFWAEKNQQAAVLYAEQTGQKTNLTLQSGGTQPAPAQAVMQQAANVVTTPAAATPSQTTSTATTTTPRTGGTAGTPVAPRGPSY